MNLADAAALPPASHYLIEIAFGAMHPPRQGTPRLGPTCCKRRQCFLPSVQRTPGYRTLQLRNCRTNTGGLDGDNWPHL